MVTLTLTNLTYNNKKGVYPLLNLVFYPLKFIDIKTNFDLIKSLSLMVVFKNFKTNKLKTIGIALLILIIIGLNFFLLNNIIGKSNSQEVFKKNIQLYK